MASFSAIQLNDQVIQSEGNYAVRREGSIYIEPAGEKLEREILRFKRNYEQIRMVTFFNRQGGEKELHLGPYEIIPINSSLLHIKKITAKSRDDKSLSKALASTYVQRLDAGITELRKVLGKEDSAVKRGNIKKELDHLLYYVNNIAQLYGIEVTRDPLETKLYNKED